MIAAAKPPEEDRQFRELVKDIEREANIRAGLVASAMITVGFVLGLLVGFLIWG